MAETATGKNKLLKNARLYIDGYDLSGDARTFSSLSSEMDEVENWGWSDSVMFVISGERLQVGISGLQVIMNDTTGRSFDNLAGSGSGLDVTIAFGSPATTTPAIPDPCYILGGVQLTDGSGFDGGIAVLGTDLKPMSGSNNGNPHGVILANKTTSSTEDLGSHDNEGATTDGWHSNIHVLSSSSGSFTFTIEHSTDDAAWSTLGTFTVDGSAIASEHLAGAGTVNQYVRMAITRVSGSAAIVVGFARK